MSPLLLVRMLSWIGTALAGWAINLRWGGDVAVGSGPPGQWERHVVGTALLCAVAALIVSIAGRGGRKPGLVARVVATAAAAGAVAIALTLRAQTGEDFAQLLEGPGWIWLTTGSGLTLAATLACWAFGGDKGQGKRRAR